MEKDVLMEMTLAELKAMAKGKVNKAYTYNLSRKEELVDKIIAYEKSIQPKPKIFEQDNTRHVFPIQEDPDIESLEYPFSHITEGDYELQDFIIPMPGEPDEDAGDFPNNISEYLWVHPGENDETPWLALVKLNNENYAYYRGEADGTGFSCQGMMELYVSKNLTTLIYMAMTNEDYRLYKNSF